MLMIAGTVRNAVQLQTLNSKWQQKVESGDVLSRDEVNERANWTEEDWMKQNFQEQCASDQESSQLAEITNKIQYGGTLTAEEEKYLEQKNPQALKKYKDMKAEKKSFERRLQNCKTKDEVQRIKTEKLCQFAAELKKVVNDPCIPLSEKLAKAKEMVARTTNIEDAEWKFVESGQYASLPTEAEEAEDRAKETEAQKEEQQEEIREGIDEQQETAEELTEATQENTEETEEATQETAEETSAVMQESAENTVETAEHVAEQAETVPTDGTEIADQPVDHPHAKPRRQSPDDEPDYAGEIEKIFKQVQLNEQLAGFDGSGAAVSAASGSSHVNLIV